MACNAKVLCHDDKCVMCFERSFASHPLAVEWHPDNNLSPRMVFKGVNRRKYKFTCARCRHVYDAILLDLSNGSGCPYCANRRLCSDEDCEICFDKSFASHEKSAFWSQSNGISPRMVTLGNNRTKYKFDCPTCKHTFETDVNHIVASGRWCPYCGIKRLCYDDNCKFCFDKSFASHDLAEYWSVKNILHPRSVFKNTHDKYWFDCPDCDISFAAALNHVNVMKSWCPNCVNKTEKKLLCWLLDQYEVKAQVRFDWCKSRTTGIRLPFDFCIEQLKILIELDGEQHFRQVSNWISPEEQQKQDLYKMDCANENGYTVVRILQEDVFHDRFDWKSELQQQIHLRTEPERVFICMNDEYKKYV